MSDLLTPKGPKRAYTADEVKVALREYYPPAEYGMAFEVAQGTGYSAHRHLDVLVMSLWPSRGLTITGIEVKVSRNDWRREKAQPEKAEELARFCDYFFVAAPKEIVPLSELPDGWGLLEMTGDKIRQSKAAPKHTPQLIDRAFVASIFRSSSRPADKDDAIKTRKIEERLCKQYDERLQRELESRKRDSVADAEKWRELTKDLDGHYIDTENVRESLKMIYRTGIFGSYQNIESLRRDLEHMLQRATSALENFKPSEKKEIAA